MPIIIIWRICVQFKIVYSSYGLSGMEDIFHYISLHCGMANMGYTGTPRRILVTYRPIYHIHTECTGPVVAHCAANLASN